MTKQEFIEKWRYELGGMVCDAATHDRKGSELAMWERRMFQKQDVILAKMYDELVPNAAVAGLPVPATVKVIETPPVAMRIAPPPTKAAVPGVNCAAVKGVTK
jgi:hypothetical protein